MRIRRDGPNQKLRWIMQRHGISHAELAEAIGMSKTTLSFRMTGKTPWTMDEVYAICDYINSFACAEEPETISMAELADYFPRRNVVFLKKRVAS